MKPDVIVIGCGFAGSVLAERFASQSNKKVLVIDSRIHVGGNMYDFIDDNGVRYHEYGPHIFHTNSKDVVDYLSNFTEWYPYEHRVLGLIQGKKVPIPFNLTSIEQCFEPEKAERLKEALISAYGMDTKVPILRLKENENEEVKELAEFIFENVFKYYTMKQWGLTVEELDPGVTARVPVLVGRDDRYFQDKYQIMPKKGYTNIFENMLNHENIEVRLSVNAHEHLRVDLRENKVYFDGEEFSGPVIFTGAVDDLLNYEFGDLSYRSLEFDKQSHTGTYQEAATVNYPTPAEMNGYTRITEYKLLMETYPNDKTTIAVEYPYAYDRHGEKGNIPYYPIFTSEDKQKYDTYCDKIKDITNLHLVGRLADYKYYNMDQIVARALMIYNQIK
ncbi:UDP-galactopyranose mutase [Anaerorhabdus sp.]|jgi:UDP-galactopyranose mutase|uniref:UDP-galactopyranose mutase n=1 Tax=Anaerorhabdus sp. TaxID=1872524 RepID=UPI002FC819DD